MGVAFASLLCDAALRGSAPYAEYGHDDWPHIDVRGAILLLARAVVSGVSHGVAHDIFGYC